MKNKSNQSLASIIITKFNKSKFLLYSIKSCLKQDYKKKQIIFFDDKSNKAWWKRRDEAFNFLNYILKRNKLSSNKSLDFFLTKLLNKILN